ncbi:nitroreductase family protein [Gordonia sinesedis]
MGRVHELIASRHSARGYDPTATIDDAALTEILDAGRWAPTWGRIQPVRFIVGRRGDDTFAGLADALTRGNAPWAPHASALILVCTTDDPDDAKAHTYAGVDVGLAVAQMILQSVALGYSGHPMAGFDAARVTETFGIPAGYRPLVLLAVGRFSDDPTVVPAEVRERDTEPRTRLPLAEVAFSGHWGTPFAAGH